MISEKKRQFLEFIRDYMERHQQAPSFTELMEGLHFRSLGTVNWYVKTLEDEGYLRRSRGPNGKRALELTDKSGDDRSVLPLLGYIAAGYPLEAIDIPEEIEVPRSWQRSENYVLRVRGDSMIEDNIQDGDYVIIRRAASVPAGRIVVAYINGEATLKRYHPRADRIELHPRNPRYGIITVSPEDEFRLGGELLYVFRKYD